MPNCQSEAPVLNAVSTGPSLWQLGMRFPESLVPGHVGAWCLVMV